jgi:dual specificity protein kinase YAK1
VVTQVTPISSSNNVQDPKRPYGGLVPSQPKGTRAYQDAASYNQHLAQHQAYTAQAATQAASTFRNPYMAQNAQQSTAPSYSGSQEGAPGFPQPQQQYTTSNQRGPTSSGQLTVNTSVPPYPNQGSGGSGLSAPSHLNPNPPTNSYYPNSRARANTINQMDIVPPALARLQHMNQDVIAGRNALTPVLNRDDAMREWERRQSGKPSTAQPYPQLEFLQQQAEMAAASGLSGWSQPSTNRYPPPPSKLAQSFHPQTIIIDDESSRRDAVMSNVRSAARSDPPANLYGSSTTSVISSPPQAYNSNSSTSGARYGTNYTQQQQTPTSPFDSLDRRTDIGNMFVPMQPDQYSYNGSNPSAQSQGAAASRHVPPSQNVPPSFYGAGVVATGQPPGASSGQPRNPFSGNEPLQQGQGGAKDSRRGNAMDVWPR